MLSLWERKRDKIGHRCTGLAAPWVWDLNPMQAEQPGPHKGSFHGAVGAWCFSGAWGAGTSHPPSLPPNPPSRPWSSSFHPFVGLFHFDFMFAHLMSSETGASRDIPQRTPWDAAPPPPLPAHSHHIYIITHTHTHTHTHTVSLYVYMQVTVWVDMNIQHQTHTHPYLHLLFSLVLT